VVVVLGVDLEPAGDRAPEVIALLISVSAITQRRQREIVRSFCRHLDDDDGMFLGPCSQLILSASAKRCQCGNEPQSLVTILASHK
jgi:hypothetical protein